MFCRRPSKPRRTSTQYNLPNNAVNSRLDKILKYRAKSCLQFFESLKEQSEDSDHSSSRSISPSLGIADNDTHDDTNEGACDDTIKGQSVDSSVEESFLSTPNERRRFSDYVEGDNTPVSEIIMKVFDNDDIEGIIPARFLKDNPDAVLDNVRKNQDIFSPVSSKRSSVDGEIPSPSYSVYMVKQLRKRLRVSTARVSRTSNCRLHRKSFTLDITDPFPYHQPSVSESLVSRTTEGSCTSSVADTDEVASAFCQSPRRHRRLGVVRSRDSVLQWLAGRVFSSTDSSRDSVSDLPERKISVPGSEASDTESYHSCSDNNVS